MVPAATKPVPAAIGPCSSLVAMVGEDMAVMQQHVRCVPLCAEEREAAVVGEVEVAAAAVE